MKRILTGPEVQPLSHGKAKSAVVMLHGVGADGENLISLSQFFASEFPDTYFIAPNGFEKFPVGVGGYQWFSYYEKPHAQIINELEQASEKLAEFLEQILFEQDLKMEDLILLGFSQGAMLAIQTAVTMQDNCAGVIGFSGGLLKVDIKQIDVRSNPPICLIHGDQDDVVPMQMSENAANILSSLNVPTEFHRIRHLGHSIDMQGIQIAKGFLSKILGS